MGYTGIFHKMSYSLWPFASCSKRRRNWNDMLFQKPFCGSHCLSEGFRIMGPMPKCVWLPPAEDLPTNFELKNSSVVDNELAFHTQWQSGWCSWTSDKWRVPFEMSLHNNGDRLSSSAVSLFSVPSLRSKSCTDFYFLEKKKISCSEFVYRSSALRIDWVVGKDIASTASTQGTADKKMVGKKDSNKIQALLSGR